MNFVNLPLFCNLSPCTTEKIKVRPKLPPVYITAEKPVNIHIYINSYYL